MKDIHVRFPPRHYDERGFFSELYEASRYDALGVGPFVQDNLSVSVEGVLRGLHYQEGEDAQGKLVTCVSGEIFDVAADVTPGSPTFGQHVAYVLYPGWQLWIPPRYAHGFYAMEDSVVLYKTTRRYAPAAARAVRWNDPTLAIPWPNPLPILSASDADAPSLRAR